MRKLITLMSLAFVLAFSGAAAARGNVVGHLSGDEEVPPVETQAQGQAIFMIRGVNLSYKLIVANITSVMASHIHCAPFGQNGPVGVTLFSGGPVTVNGILAQGPILMPNPNNPCGWVDLSEVIAAIQSGNTYVNVHTLDNPSGEIRGQLD